MNTDKVMKTRETTIKEGGRESCKGMPLETPEERIESALNEFKQFCNVNPRLLLSEQDCITQFFIILMKYIDKTKYTLYTEWPRKKAGKAKETGAIDIVLIDNRKQLEIDSLKEMDLEATFEFKFKLFQYSSEKHISEKFRDSNIKSKVQEDITKLLCAKNSKLKYVIVILSYYGDTQCGKEFDDLNYLKDTEKIDLVTIKIFYKGAVK